MFVCWHQNDGFLVFCYFSFFFFLLTLLSWVHAFNHRPYFKVTCQLVTWLNRRNFADKPDRSKSWKFLKSIRKKPIRRRWFTRHNKISINAAKKKISVKDPLLISYNQMRRSRLEDFRRAFFASNQLNNALGKWRIKRLWRETFHWKPPCYK